MTSKLIWNCVWSVFLCLAANAQSVNVSTSQRNLSPNLQLVINQSDKSFQTGAHKNLYKIVCSDVAALQSVIKSAGHSVEVLKYNAEYKAYVLQIPNRVILQKILEMPSVSYADLYFPPKEELEIGNYEPTLNRINLMQKKYPTSDGTGLAVSIKENGFDTLDIDFKGRHIASGISSSIVTNHASVMATLVGGAGNTSAASLGVAPGVSISSSNFSNLFPDALSYLQQANISVQNHSYGTVIENYYGAEARAYDLQLNALPNLAHVFSVGNSGTATPATGTYAGLPGWANSTGNFKSSKNSVVVSATDSFNNIPIGISKGPAYDGRLIPQITAFGEDGSSGAAAIVSGTIISMQHLYKQLYGTFPATALLRAILFNSADDIGAEGIDFASGYGALNAVKAADNIANSRFFSANISQGNEQVFSVVIPAGIKKVKFTLAWNDPAAEINSKKALVNDVDLIVVRQTDQRQYKPWVLNHFPQSDSLKQLPTQKTDTLNNTEQISFDNPLPGTYQIKVIGRSIPVGPQPVFVAYQFDSTNYFEFTNPVKNNQFLAGKSNIIRWQQTLSGKGVLQYTTDQLNWQTIANDVDLNKGYFVWQTPDISALANLRMLSPVSFLSDSFVISKPPVLNVGFNCESDFMLWWLKQKNAIRYDLYRLGPKFMELFLSTTDTFAVFLKNNQPALHYAVRPILAIGVAAQRSAAYNYTTQGVDCFVQTFLAELNVNQADLRLELGTVLGLQSLVVEKQKGNSFFTLKNFDNPLQLKYAFTDFDLQTGLNSYRIKGVRSNGQIFYSNLASVYFFGNQPYLLFPNPIPANGSFHVIASAINSAQLQLYNMMGQLVMTQPIKLIDKSMSTFGLSAGLYLYSILENNAVVQSGKLLIY